MGTKRFKASKIAFILGLLIGMSLFPLLAVAQDTGKQLSIEWQHYLLGTSGTSVISTSDGGYLALGANSSTYSITDSDLTFAQTEMAKTDSSGNITWSKVLSLGNSAGMPYSDTQLKVAVQTSDGYLLAGWLNQQAFLVKIDPDGNVIWQKTYEELEGFNQLIQTSDGGYAMLGPTPESGSPIAQYKMMKVDSQGNLLWLKGYSGNDTLMQLLGFPLGFSGTPSAIFQTSDQGYLIAGTGGRHGPNPVASELFKLDSNGSLEWMNDYGGDDDFYFTTCTSAITASDGYLLAGTAQAHEGVNKGFILKTDLQGNAVWNKTYTYSGFPSTINSISNASDSNFMFLGTATKQDTYGIFDSNTRVFTWLAEVTSSGTIQGQLAIPMGAHQSEPASLIQSADGGHVFVGVWNESGDLFSGKFWIAKISETQSPSQLNSFLSIPPLDWAIVIIVLISVAAVAVIVRKRMAKSAKTTNGFGGK
jgi:hypothetical protein